MKSSHLCTTGNFISKLLLTLITEISIALVNCDVQWRYSANLAYCSTNDGDCNKCLNDMHSCLYCSSNGKCLPSESEEIRSLSNQRISPPSCPQEFLRYCPCTSQNDCSSCNSRADCVWCNSHFRCRQVNDLSECHEKIDSVFGCLNVTPIIQPISSMKTTLQESNGNSNGLSTTTIIIIIVVSIILLLACIVLYCFCNCLRCAKDCICCCC